ncbi:class I SAM-dependent methyltransferase, partial [bacterium]|nr:class I SAM-dependent methyltransferase [bacterium]
GGGCEAPHWFDHRIDLFTWSGHLNPHWVERGVYSYEVMKSGCTVLDLGCGDGFYPYYFYSIVASRIDAIDIEPSAITHARKFHNHSKIHYYQQDIVSDSFPADNYDIVTWDGAIGHFSKDEIQVIMSKIRDVLGQSGTLTGYEVIETKENKSWDHKIALTSVGNLKRLLNQYFPYVGIFETFSPGRHNVYFRCSLDVNRLGRFK